MNKPKVFRLAVPVVPTGATMAIRYILPLCALAVLAVGQTAPSVTAVTNAALPGMDMHVPTRLQPRSMATIFGTNLSNSTETATPVWVKTLGGTEVHIVPVNTGCGTANPPANLGCELIADLVYVSQTQINFVVPDVSPSAYGQQELPLEVVLVENAQRFDTHVSFSISTIGDFAVFGVGYECDFALSLAHPEACGYSQTPGPNKVPIGAITDASGNLITSQNPVHQGQPIVLWATGLRGLNLDPTTGLLQQKTPDNISLGLSHATDLNGDWKQLTPTWAGEAPQFVGLDQVNLTAPVCNGVSAATEQRYDMTLNFRAPSADTSRGIGFATLYIPFVLRPGEATCQSDPTATITTASSSANPLPPGQSVILTASVSPPDATGTVIFFDGTNALGIGTLVGGSATCGINNACSTSGLGVGGHSITVTYNGDSTHKSSSATLNQAVTQNTNITLISSANPAASEQSVTLSATVSPCCTATGTVAFLDGSTTIGSAPLVSANGALVATLSTTGLSGGTHSITAVYGGDSYDYSSTSAVLTQTVAANTVSLSIAYSPSTVFSGLPVTFAVTLSSTAPTGTISLFDGNVTLGTNGVNNGKATFSVAALSGGNHTITATYNGDSKFSSAFNSITLSVYTPAPDVTNFNISNQKVIWQLDGSFVAQATFSWTLPTASAGGVRYAGVVLYKVLATATAPLSVYPMALSSQQSNVDQSFILDITNIPTKTETWTIAAISVDYNGVLADDPAKYGQPGFHSPTVTWVIGPPTKGTPGGGQEYAPLVTINASPTLTATDSLSADGVGMVSFTLGSWTNPSSNQFGGAQAAMVINGNILQPTYWPVPGRGTTFTTPSMPSFGRIGGPGVPMDFYIVSINPQGQRNSLVPGVTPVIHYTYTPTAFPPITSRH
jgi:uncharacterized protein (TIGR03437 family)